MAITHSGITVGEPKEEVGAFDLDEINEMLERPEDLLMVAWSSTINEQARQGLIAVTGIDNLPTPCDRCGWNYPLAVMAEAASDFTRGQAWDFDETPTHLCIKPSIDSDPVAAQVFGPVAKWGHLPR